VIDEARLNEELERVGVTFTTAGTAEYLSVTILLDGVMVQGPPRGKRKTWFGSLDDLEDTLAELEDKAGPDALWEALGVD